MGVSRPITLHRVDLDRPPVDRAIFGAPYKSAVFVSLERGGKRVASLVLDRRTGAVIESWTRNDVYLCRG